MDDAVRFSDGDDQAARRLMLAMRDERPPPGAANRALAALGVSGATMLTTSAALGGNSAGGALGKSLTALAFKWLGAGAAIGLATATGASLLPLERDAAPEPAVASAPKTAPAARTERTPRLAAPAPAPAIDPPAPAPAPAPARRANAPATEATQAPSVASFEPPPAADSLEREIELLDQARGAVRRNAPDAALAKLDQFAREFPRGRLASEAFVVRLEALVRAGRAAEARAIAGAHLARNPSSPHAARIRRIVGLEAP